MYVNTVQSDVTHFCKDSYILCYIIFRKYPLYIPMCLEIVKQLLD